jgi:predicted nucleic acid-binding protein
MTDAAVPAVLDCMIFAQAMISPRGPAGECLERAAKGEFTIVLSPHVISEILELPGKLPPKFAITGAQVSDFLDELTE